MPIFKQHIRHIPDLDANGWLLILDGAVKRPLTLTYNTLTNQFTQTTREMTVVCAGHQPDHPLIMNAAWRGVQLVDLIAYCESTRSDFVANFYCADGYATSLPVRAIQDALLVTHMNDQPLPREHGYPARLIVPNKAGYKMPKWIQHIVIGDEAVSGYWESRGWSAEGGVPAMVTIESDQPTYALGEAVTLSGLAVGISVDQPGVGISINGADPALIPLNARSDGITRAWQTIWQPQFAGHYAVTVHVASTSATTIVKVEA